MTVGIYRIVFSNGMTYVGQSRDIEKRMATHYRKMTAGSHSNKKINYHVSTYGMPRWEIIEELSITELNTREKYWISYYDSFNNGLNLTRGGAGSYIIPTINRVPSKNNNIWELWAYLSLGLLCIGAFCIIHPLFIVLIAGLYIGSTLI